MNNKLILAIAMFMAIFLITANAIVLTNGDNSKESEALPFMHFVKFTAPKTGYLTGIDTYIHNQHHRAYLTTIQDSNHNNIKGNWRYLGNSSWNWIYNNIGYPIDSSLEFNTDDEFYAGIRNCLNGVSLGLDTNSPNSGKNEYCDGNCETWKNDSKNYMIKAYFNTYPTISNLSFSQNPANHLTTLTGTSSDDEDNIWYCMYSIDTPNIASSWHWLNASDGAYDSNNEDFNVIINTLSLSEGTHTIYTECRDTSGFRTKPQVTIDLNVDRTKPSTSYTILETPTNGWYNSIVNIDLTATDNFSGVKEIWMSYTGATTNPWVVTYNDNTNVVLGNDGVTTVHFYAKDNAGNIEDEQTITIPIDRTSPDAPVLHNFPNNYINDTNYTISWDASTDGTSGINHYNLYRKVDSGSYPHYKTVSNTWFNETLEKDHNYSYYVTAVDWAGNESDVSNSDWLIVDLNAPEKPVLHQLPGYTPDENIVITWDAPNDAGLSGLASYDINKENDLVDNVLADYNQASYTQSYVDDGNIAGDSHGLFDRINYIYSVRAIDGADNNGDWSNRSGTTIDWNDPVTTAVFNPATPNGLNGWYVSPVTITLTADDGYHGSGIANIYDCINCGGDADSVYTSPVTLSMPGDYNFKYRSEDDVGHFEETHTKSFKIDLTPPTGQSIDLNNGLLYKTDNRTIHADLNTGTDYVSGLWYCEINWNDGNGWENIDLNTSAEYTYSTDGSKTVEYKCYDNAGNVSDTVFDTIIVDTTDPMSNITNLVNEGHYIKGNQIIRGIAFDATSGVKEVKIKIWKREAGNDWNKIMDWTTVNGTIDWDYTWSNAEEGYYLIKTKAFDLAGNDENSSELQDDKYKIQVMQNLSPYFESFFNSGTNKVLFYGYLPKSNTDYNINVFDSSDASETTLHHYNITTDGNAEFFLEVDVSDWDKNVTLYSAEVEGTGLKTNLNGLALVRLKEKFDEDMNYFWNVFMQTQEGTIWLDYFPKETLTVYGKAPYDSVKANIVVKDLNGIIAKRWNGSSYENADVNVGVSSNFDYAHQFTTISGWGAKVFNVWVTFYDASDNELETINSIFDGLDYGNYGFKEINVTGNTPYLYVKQPLNINFLFKTAYPGDYDFYALKINHDTGTLSMEKIIENEHIQAHSTYDLSGLINLDEDGNYHIGLIAEEPSGQGNTMSMRYIGLEYYDLADRLDANVTITTPTENSDMSKPYPYGSIVDNVYWTQPGIITFKEVGISNTPPQTGLKLSFTDELGNSLPLNDGDQEFDFNTGNQYLYEQEINTNGQSNNWNNTNYFKVQNPITEEYVPAYTKILAEFIPVIKVSGTDYINVGLDNTSPIISNLNPNAGNKVGGIIVMNADVEDDLSGVKEVWFRLYTKDSYGNNDVLKWAKKADFNASNSKWEVDFNTFEVEDGNYNLDVNATDIAGNSASEFVDPIIDNTAPTINSITITSTNGFPHFRGEKIIVTANITDNLSGVNNAKIKIITPSDLNNSMDMNYVGGNTWTADYYTDVNFDVGDYNLIVEAFDSVSPTPNHSSETSSFYLNYSLLVTLELSSYEVTKGTTITVTGHVETDNGSTYNDNNVGLITLPSGSVNANIDDNGYFTTSYTTDTSGTFTIIGNVTANNEFDFNDSKELKVNNPSAPPEEETTTTGGGGGGGGGGSGLKTCDIDNVQYSEWGECVNGVQTRDYSFKSRCKGNIDESKLELERKCNTSEENNEETSELSEEKTCNDDNPCTSGRWYKDHCVYDKLSGNNCYKDGVIGVCDSGECVVPQQQSTQEKSKQNNEKTSNAGTGFFGLGDAGTAIIGLIMLLIIGLGYAGFKKFS